jgi:hypothetical protein
MESHEVTPQLAGAAVGRTRCVCRSLEERAERILPYLRGPMDRHLAAGNFELHHEQLPSF